MRNRIKLNRRRVVVTIRMIRIEKNFILRIIINIKIINIFYKIFIKKKYFRFNKKYLLINKVFIYKGHYFIFILY